MSNTPKFFVPAANGNDEAAYADFAKKCSVQTPALADRIYSITWRHDGADMTATVGQSLVGTGFKTTGRGKKAVTRPFGVSDPAIVLAIFPGNTYQVFTSGGIAHKTAWANPIYAGRPDAVTLFSLS